MVDGLSDEERILAWNASWHPSFSGIAIVNEDFTFRSVNPQFSKLLGVTPADLIGKRFQDITPVEIRELDEKNAELIIDGKIDFYVLPKSYSFADGSTVDVVLLVTRAPPASEGEFRFFLSRIMLDEKGELMQAGNMKSTNAVTTSPPLMAKVKDFLNNNYWWLAAIGTILGVALMTVYAPESP